MNVNGNEIEFDKDGFMTKPALWNDEVAAAIAKEEGIDEISDKHWAVIRFIRSHWEENDIAPAVRLLCQEAGIKVREVYSLFRSGPARGACRIAGLPKPDGCV